MLADFLSDLEQYVQRDNIAPSPISRSGADVIPLDIVETLARRRFDPAEVAARRQLAGVPLQPVPDYCATYIAGGANALFDVQLPDAISVVCFSALITTDFRVSFGGNLSFTVSTSGDGSIVPLDALVCPLGRWFYVKNLRTLKLGIVNAGAAVSVFGNTQL